MAESMLKMIQRSIIQYAEIISYIIRADVEIVDNSLQCVARYSVSENVHNNGFLSIIYKEVLTSGEFRIIENPRRNTICNNCDDKFRCLKKMEVCFPIILDGVCIGAVGIICYNISQKEAFLKDLDIYAAFINKIISLMCAAIREFQDKTDTLSVKLLMESAMECSSKGYIIFDGDYRILKFNKMAAAILKLSSGDIGKTAIITDEEEQVLENKVYKIVVNNTFVNVLGTEIKSSVTNNQYNSILVFEIMPTVNMPVFELSSNPGLFPVEAITGSSQEIEKVRSKISKIALTSSTVMVFGEKGVGKELAARCIHHLSERRSHPFVVIDCEAVADELLELELFGLASQDDNIGFPGKLELADKGVLFLDKVETLSYYLQDKLINVIRTKTFKRKGANNSVRIDVRFIGATCLDYYQAKNKNRPLSLFSAVNIIPLGIPALWERKDDAAELFLNLCKRYTALYDKTPPEISGALLKAVSTYKWPGNVRELESRVQHWIYTASADNPPDPADFINAISVETDGGETEEPIPEEQVPDEIPTLKELEEKYIAIALKKFGNTTEGKKKAAKSLGIGIATLYRKLADMDKS